MSSYEMGKDINESWLRCISEGLDPFNDPKQSVISSIELKEIKERNEAVRRIIIPELELLYSQIAGTNFMVAYSDEKGLVLDTIYDKSCLQTDVGKTVIPGSIWAEKICGTNGLGLSVELKKPTIVSGKEHFFTAHENISCFASPIINYDGKIIGIIDASTDSMSREQHTLALVRLATRSIETKLFIKKFENELIISFHPRQEYLTTTSVGMLAINGDGLIVGANNNAKIMLNGLVDLKNENFNKIFTTSFSSIASDILNNKTLKITDHLGSSVFVVKSQNFKESKFIETDKQNKTYACKNCEDTKIKREKCILIRSTFSETNNISAVSRKLGVSRTTIYKHLN
ncbi:GAF domain-containing protein [Candidatus Pelagibacter sp. HIMB1521]|uniref:sigma-54-dependent Fis family transcriptional regulator n=1 Tax=Candidatus Pelagibacter sp. HIMB1521 TaxID=3413344 RepID=UPI003F82C766